MPSLVRNVTGGTIAAILLAACTSTAEDAAETQDWTEDARLGDQVDRICFRDNIDNFRSATRNSVIVERGVNDEYLIETFSACFDLDNANSLSFDSFGGSSCLSKGDSIKAYSSAFGPSESDFPSVDCPIKAIYEWNEDAAEDETETAEEEPDA